MTEQPLYRVEELHTNGWETVAFRLPKDKAKEKLDECMSQGTSPERLRVIREQ
jgi:hypothetical protein